LELDCRDCFRTGVQFSFARSRDDRRQRTFDFINNVVYPFLTRNNYEDLSIANKERTLIAKIMNITKFTKKESTSMMFPIR
jgi:hypothetical protein